MSLFARIVTLLHSTLASSIPSGRGVFWFIAFIIMADFVRGAENQKTPRPLGILEASVEWSSVTILANKLILLS